jgi:hypothetical protein
MGIAVKLWKKGKMGRVFTNLASDIPARKHEKGSRLLSLIIALASRGDEVKHDPGKKISARCAGERCHASQRCYLSKPS